MCGNTNAIDIFIALHCICTRIKPDFKSSNWALSLWQNASGKMMHNVLMHKCYALVQRKFDTCHFSKVISLCSNHSWFDRKMLHVLIDIQCFACVHICINKNTACFRIIEDHVHVSSLCCIVDRFKRVWIWRDDTVLMHYSACGAHRKACHWCQNRDQHAMCACGTRIMWHSACAPCRWKCAHTTWLIVPLAQGVTKWFNSFFQRIAFLIMKAYGKYFSSW
jgi:hypothetical protein